MKCFACEKHRIFEENGKLVQIIGQYGYVIGFWDHTNFKEAEKWDPDFEIAIDYCPYCGRNLTTNN